MSKPRERFLSASEGDIVGHVRLLGQHVYPLSASDSLASAFHTPFDILPTPVYAAH